MSIHRALQLSYGAAQFKLRRLNVGHGSDQILGGHLVDLLRREQTELRRLSLLQQLSQFLRGARANALHVDGRQRSFLRG